MQVIPPNLPSLHNRARTLHEIFPDHAITPFASVNILGFPGALVHPVSPDNLVTNNFFVPLATRLGKSNGVLVSQVRFGSFHIAWSVSPFIVMWLVLTF